MALAVASIIDAMLQVRPEAAELLAELADSVQLGELGPGGFVNTIKRKLGPTALLEALLLMHGVPHAQMNLGVLKRHILSGCNRGMACPMPACRAVCIMKAHISGQHCVPIGCSLGPIVATRAVPAVTTPVAMAINMASLQLAAAKISSNSTSSTSADMDYEMRSETPAAWRLTDAGPLARPCSIPNAAQAAAGNVQSLVQATVVRASPARAMPIVAHADPAPAPAATAPRAAATADHRTTSNAAHSLLFLARTASRGVFAELNIDRSGASPYSSPTGSPMGTPPEIRKRSKTTHNTPTTPNTPNSEQQAAGEAIRLARARLASMASRVPAQRATVDLDLDTLEAPPLPTRVW